MDRSCDAEEGRPRALRLRPRSRGGCGEGARGCVGPDTAGAGFAGGINGDVAAALGGRELGFTGVSIGLGETGGIALMDCGEVDGSGASGFVGRVSNAFIKAGDGTATGAGAETASGEGREGVAEAKEERSMSGML